MLENYSHVRLMTDRYGAQGVHAGDQGYIIEVYGDVCEVDFLDEEGMYLVQILAREEELQVIKAEAPPPQPFGNIVVINTRGVSTSSSSPRRKKLPPAK